MCETFFRPCSGLLVQPVSCHSRAAAEEALRLCVELLCVELLCVELLCVELLCVVLLCVVLSCSEVPLLEIDVVPPMIGFEDEEHGRGCLHADFANKVRVWVPVEEEVALPCECTLWWRQSWCAA
jgi:hypothetical protein